MITTVNVRLGLAAGILILVGTGFQAIRVAWAESLLKQPGWAAAKKAGGVDPLNPKAFLAQAQYDDQEGRNSEASWARAVQLDPRNPRILIPAGISAELAGNKPLAEEYFRSAKTYNQTWLPRWTLANFYFRQGNQTEALSAMRQAMDRSYGDLTAAFNLCIEAGATPEQIAKSVLPPQSNAYEQFLNFLGASRIDNTTAAVMKDVGLRYIKDISGARKTPAPQVPILIASTRLIENGFGSPARLLWRTACETGLLICTAPPDDGVISNGAFSVPFYQTGFDWCIRQQPGVSIVHQPGSGTVKISLHGNQPESADVLFEPVLIPGKQSFRVTFEYRTRDITSRQSGFEWRLGDSILPLNKPIASESWDEAYFTIPASTEDRLATLALLYRRKFAATTMEGELWLRNLRAGATR